MYKNTGGVDLYSNSKSLMCYVTAVTAGQGHRLFSGVGVRRLTGFSRHLVHGILVL
jgi:hypothetical protein